jgi:hypothetical protein
VEYTGKGVVERMKINVYLSPGMVMRLTQLKAGTLYYGKLYAVFTGPDKIKLYTLGLTDGGPIQLRVDLGGWTVVGIHEPCRILVDGEEQIWIDVNILPIKNEPCMSKSGPAVGVYNTFGES